MEVFDKSTARGLNGGVGTGIAGGMIFPSDLVNEDQFMLMTIYKYKRPTRDQKNRKERVAEITLPLPSNLVDNVSVSYQQKSLGLIGNKFGGTVGDAFNNIRNGADPISQVKSIADKIKSSSVGQEVGDIIAYYGAQFLQEGGGAALGGYIGGPLGAAVGAGATELINGAFYGAGIARNPFNVQMFENVNFRSFNFQYKFVPTSKTDSKILDAIIRKLKYHMLPSYTDSSRTFFTYPDIFEIFLASGGSDKYLFKMHTCVLEAVNTNYQPDGAFYHNLGSAKAPVSLQLDLAFKEMIIPSREDYDPAAFDKELQAGDEVREQEQRAAAAAQRARVEGSR